VYDESFFTFDLDIDGLESISSPATNSYIPVFAGANKKISIADLAALIGGGGGGGTSDHGELDGLGDDDHTQYYNQMRGDARYAKVAGSSQQDFAVKDLTAAGTIVAQGNVTGYEVYRGSARKLKKDIKDLTTKALPIIVSTKIYKYKLKANNSKAIGFIADETHELLSGETKDKHLFGNHLALLTKAIQEQQKQIEDLKKELKQMKKLLKKQNNGRR
jgi:hypothetical protein